MLSRTGSGLIWKKSGSAHKGFLMDKSGSLKKGGNENGSESNV